MSGFIARTRRLTPARIIIFGFLALILAGAALLTLALFLLLFVFFLRDYDRVSEWEGQTVVAEYRGIDRGSHQCPRVCRYESWLLRGEELGPGR